MYRASDFDHKQLSLHHFNQSCGMQLDLTNDWFRNANRLPWEAWESLYAALFPGTKGNVAKPCRMALGSLIIQMRMGFSDRDLVKQIQENPYYQFFIGLDEFQTALPFTPPLLVTWRKRLDAGFIIKANDALCDAMPKAKRRSRKSFGSSTAGTLIATQICDATVAPQYIRYPQDTSLLNEARLKLEGIIDNICSANNLPKPRTYRKVAHKEYLAIAKMKKPSTERRRKAVQQQLSYVSRDLKYVDAFIQSGYELDEKCQDLLEVIRNLYEQQQYMYDNKTHVVENRIVSISQPYVRPIVRGKASKPTEFGAKLHLSIDERGFARVEYLSFDAFNEGPMLQEALNAYKYHHGYYPERVLVDQIYRTESNLAFCKKNGIRISGKKRGRPFSDEKINRKIVKTAAMDNSDRIQIERYFSVAKRKNGMGLITKKREDTSLSTIAMSVLVTNIFGSFKLALEELE